MITSETVRAYFQDNHASMTETLRGPLSTVRARGDEDALEEAVHNTITLAFENVLRCAANGKIGDAGDLTRYANQSLWWAVRHTRMGRTIIRKSSPDKKYGDFFESMTPHNVCWIDGYIGQSTPVPDTVAFRLDSATFFDTLTDRQRGMASGLMAGMTTTDVAREQGVTPGAVSQFRTRFFMLWRGFFGEV